MPSNVKMDGLHGAVHTSSTIIRYIMVLSVCAGLDRGLTMCDLECSCMWCVVVWSLWLWFVVTWVSLFFFFLPLWHVSLPPSITFIIGFCFVKVNWDFIRFGSIRFDLDLFLLHLFRDKYSQVNLAKP